MLHGVKEDRSPKGVSTGSRVQRRAGIERRQLQKAFLEHLYHRTVISLGGDLELLSCIVSSGAYRPSLKQLVEPQLDRFIDLFHDRWYYDHRKTTSTIKGQANFEMYDGQ